MANFWAEYPVPIGGSGSGTVTSVGLSDSTGLFTITGSPVTTSGTLDITSSNTLAVSEALFTDSGGQVKSNAITGTGNVVMSASPTLTGTAGMASLTLSGSAKKGNYHVEPSENAVSVSGAATTVDLSTAAAQALTLGASTTLTLTNPQVGGAYVFRIIQGASSYTVTWPASVLWSGGTAPVITTTNGYTDIINLYWDGTNYYGSFSQNYAT